MVSTRHRSQQSVLVFMTEDEKGPRGEEDSKLKSLKLVDVLSTDRINRQESNLRATEFYLKSNIKSHLPGLSRSEKEVVRKQARRFVLRQGKMCVSRKLVAINYVDNAIQRQEVIAETHQ